MRMSSTPACTRSGSAAGDTVEKLADGAAEFFGGFLLGEVADVGQDEQAGVAKGGGEAESFLGRQQAVLLSPEDESRGLDSLQEVLVAAGARADRDESGPAGAGNFDRRPTVVDGLDGHPIGMRVEAPAQGDFHDR